MEDEELTFDPLVLGIGDEALRQTYSLRRPLLEKMGNNIRQALESFLIDQEIDYLSLYYRIKSLDSFLEKAKRKKYSNPLDDCEDLCGVRIICYYPSDVEKISNVIRREFEVHESIDKAALLGIHEFGYRSTHFIVSVNKRWLVAPNYRGLGDVKAEIQVRTILMHAWAEIEHKLAYKKSEQVPDQFRRTLYRLSAKFEEADEQFEDLKKGLAAYREEISSAAIQSGEFDETLDLNLETIRALLDFLFPSRRRVSVKELARLLDQLLNHGLAMKDLLDSYRLAASFLPQFEREVFGGKIELSQAGALRAVVDLGNADFWEKRRSPQHEDFGPIVEKYRAKIDRKASEKRASKKS